MAFEADPSKYKAEDVLCTNLDHKLTTIRKRMVEAGIEKFKFVFVEDRRSERKYKLFPAYKGNREEHETDPRPIAKEWLKKQGLKTFVYSPDNEADDTLATLCAKAGKNPVIIVSSDKDLWQLLEPPRIAIYSIRKDDFIWPKDLEEEYGISEPRHLPLYKALWGDRGDNIPNAVPRMQKQLLPVIKKSDGSLRNFADMTNVAGDSLTKKCWELLAKGKDQVEINYQLVKLDTECPLVWETT